MPHVDNELRRAAFLPGPGQYTMPSLATSPVAKWGEQQAKSDVDWQIYRAKDLPGPGEYKNVHPQRKSGAFRFSKHNPKSEFEWIIYRAQQLPGPASYADKVSPPKRRRMQDLVRAVHSYKKSELEALQAAADK